jgi:glyoxylase-like metal-dependent hydrolase (beta-lactamase superfamily II)
LLRYLTVLPALLFAFQVHADVVEPESPPDATQVALGVWLIPGGVRPDRQPDGNSVVFDAPAGLVVVDTGRHRWHRDAILSLARAQQRNIVAIVNTHWHLDHVSGNPDLRAAYPGLRVYASNAIDGALAGFLAQSAKDSAQYLDDPEIPESMRDDIRGDLRTVENGAALKPDVVIGSSGTVTIGGHAFEMHVAQDAVTAGDVWLYDEGSRVAVLGDLVTLPAPFLDTACPAGWKNALAEVAATPFEVAIPGHGTPMTRAQFEQYRRAFDAFITCAESAGPAQECGAQWVDSVGSLLVDAATEKPRAQGMAEYYVGMLRASGGRSEYCQAGTVAR